MKNCEDRWGKCGEALKVSQSSLALMLWGASQRGGGDAKILGARGCQGLAKPQNKDCAPLWGARFSVQGFSLDGTSDIFLGIYSLLPY